MDHNKYTVIDSRLYFDRNKSFDSISKENGEFKQNSAAKKPQFSVETRYFTVDMRPLCTEKLECRKTQGSLKLDRLKSTEKTRELDNSYPVNTISSESFHSCHSTISFQEVNPKNTNKGERNSASSSNESAKPKSIPDEELLQNLTMVNAIFLNNSVGECSHGKHYKKAHQESRSRDTSRNKKGNNVSQHSFKSSTQESFACLTERPGIDYVDNICGDNSKAFFDGFTYNYPENNIPRWSQKNCNPINVTNPFTSKFIDETTDPNYNRENKYVSQIPESKFNCRKRKHAILKASISKRNTKVNKIKSAYTSSTCNGHYTPEPFEKGHKSITEKRKHPVNQAEKIHFFEPTYLNNSYVVIHRENKLSTKTTRHKQSYFMEDGKGNKKMPHVNESINIRRSAKHNWNKMRNEPETYSNLNTHNPVYKTKEETNYFQKDIGDVLNFHAGHSDTLDTDAIILQSSKSLSMSSERNKSQLSVIQEEELESEMSNSSANVEDDYCLTDTNGRPIHLFDSRGLPLTDGRGRPLKTAQNKIIMECDQNGIPAAGNGAIYDMFGRQPHDEGFDPSRAPETPVCNKLYTSDGGPLLLYDVEGRPLTSVSGSMLVDSKGRELVQLTTNP